MRNRKNNMEVAGVYHLTEADGDINGIDITIETYEYFDIILKHSGVGIIKSKMWGGLAYKNKGKYTYSDGIILLTSKNGQMSVTEELYYEYGKIIYKLETLEMDLELEFVRGTK